MSELLIIGNGLDLRIGLKSRFSDYFSACELSNVILWVEKRGNPTPNFSLISLLLYNTFYNEKYVEVPVISKIRDIYLQKLQIDGKMIDWMDVEGFLYTFLNSNVCLNLIKIIENIMNKDKYTEICRGDRVADFIKVVLNNRNYVNYDPYTIILKELNIFENSLKCYIEKEMKNNDSYETRFKYLLGFLAPSLSDTTILSFNYTYCPNLVVHNGFVNVHGKCNNAVIVGIDNQYIDNKIDDNKNLAIFTKTFRKMLHINTDIVLSNKINYIVIYGHSLGSQDYSYFQSIFDFLDIYHNRIIVKLVYSDYYMNNDLEKEQYRIDIIRKLYLLLDTYGETLENKNHGKNLVHKLLLENRLVIEKNNFEGISDCK